MNGQISDFDLISLNSGPTYFCDVCTPRSRRTGSDRAHALLDAHFSKTSEVCILSRTRNAGARCSPRATYTFMCGKALHVQYSLTANVPLAASICLSDRHFRTSKLGRRRSFTCTALYVGTPAVLSAPFTTDHTYRGVLRSNITTWSGTTYCILGPPPGLEGN